MTPRIVGLIGFVLIIVFMDYPGKANRKEDITKSGSPMWVTQQNSLPLQSFEYNFRSLLDKQARAWRPNRPYGQWKLKVCDRRPYSNIVIVEGDGINVEKSFAIRVDATLTPDLAERQAFPQILDLIKLNTADQIFLN